MPDCYPALTETQRLIRDTARKAGCDAFVSKPCLPDALVTEVRKMLETARKPGRSRSA